MYGAATRDGEEVVNGMVMMLKGENSAAVTERIKERVVQIQKSLPDNFYGHWNRQNQLAGRRFDCYFHFGTNAW